MARNSENIKKGKRNSPLYKKPPRVTSPFATADELLDACQIMFRARQILMQERMLETKVVRERIKTADQWTSYFHSRRIKSDNILICKCLKAYQLSDLESEIIYTLICDKIGLLQERICDAGELVSSLGLSGKGSVQVLRCVSEFGTLYKESLICYDDPDEDIRDRRLLIDPNLVDMVIKNDEAQDWSTKNEKDLLKLIFNMTRVYVKIMESHDSLYGSNSDFFRNKQLINRMRSELEKMLQFHPDWKLSLFCKTIKESIDRSDKNNLIDLIIILFGKEYGHKPADHELYTGSGLARATAKDISNMSGSLELLKSNSPLVQKTFIQPCGGRFSLISDHESEISKTEYELSQKSLDILQIKRQISKKYSDESAVRLPQVKMEQLVLPENVQEALRMAVAQAENIQLFQKWNLGKTINYGTGLIILMYGPPGTGKTATAEALADRLNKPILYASYSEIQDCFVGVTEKNIVKLFREARKYEALLFLDEVDSMLFDRDTASHTWEIRDINILLTELERFDGICCMATNRPKLDKALERRVSIKIEFKRPDKSQRCKIWRNLIPKEMPLEKDVNFELLSEYDLSGGEIKNIILNAARICAARKGTNKIVTLGDFTKAIDMELKGKWSKESREIGFKN